MGSRLARSSVLVSPDGNSRAYAEVEALLADGECMNTSRLFLSRGQDRPYALVYMEEPTRWQMGNAMRVVDWSADGRALLIEQLLFQYASDAGGKAVLIFDNGLFIKPAIPDAFSRYFGKECAIGVAEALGFSPRGGIVFKALPDLYDDAGDLNAGACLSKDGIWLLDLDSETVEPLPDNYQPQRYGKWEKPRSKR